MIPPLQSFIPKIRIIPIIFDKPIHNWVKESLTTALEGDEI